MAKPLGLPVGSVRALLLLALTARAILDLRAGRDVAPWLWTALLVSAAGYFSARAAARPAPAPAFAGAPGEVEVRGPRPPLGLPAGTIRTLFLLAVGYGTWLWTRAHPIAGSSAPVVLVLGAFLVGVVVRWLLARAHRPEDAATLWFEHVQALIALLAAGGLVALGAGAGPLELPEWGEAALAAVGVYYVGAR